ncbi:rhodanese-related sulfurtransferase [Paenibacillus taihuensis]|uniref:Rhodanese-related sulfurtransferase n=1 Tax=Paenibacillus taihuensis TaxID=1156355 RepID=A0A3D9SKR9_9BACL|nr:rhodanese-like domain-containing protein [Paenibacillus taihuensis]REE91510.1 rhodanese-related sulfurtransferase [Paenibacillus taihuensis]
MDFKWMLEILIIAALIWFVYKRFAGVKDLKNLMPDQFQNELKSNQKKILIDVREPMELQQGYIPGAINIPLSQMKKRLSEIPKDRKIFLYCRSGMRSMQAARILRKDGYRDLAHLHGGIVSWKRKLAK